MNEELLNIRSQQFLEIGKSSIRKGFFDLAAFHLEQALQLRLKYFLAKRIGYFSKTHMLSSLFKEAERVEPKLRDFVNRNKERIEELEVAYTGSRYLPIKYTKDKVEKLLKFVEEAFKVIG